MRSPRRREGLSEDGPDPGITGGKPGSVDGAAGCTVSLVAPSWCTLSAMVRVLHWNGKDLPEELRDLPPGEYILVDSTPGLTDLTPLDEQGLLEAMDEVDGGEVVPWEKVRDELAKKFRSR